MEIDDIGARRLGLELPRGDLDTIGSTQLQRGVPNAERGGRMVLAPQWKEHHGWVQPAHGQLQKNHDDNEDDESAYHLPRQRRLWGRHKSTQLAGPVEHDLQGVRGGWC